LSSAVFEFGLHATQGRARAGVFSTLHGDLLTPVFAPVGTQATVKMLTPAQVEDLGATLVLANTYHLFLRPGDELVRDVGGLHEFMQWHHPLLTDSGGYQVFSLAQTRKIDDGGVTFQSHIDGSTHRFTPSAPSASRRSGRTSSWPSTSAPTPTTMPTARLPWSGPTAGGNRPRPSSARIKPYLELSRAAWTRG
jgi:hypothetical protein